MKGRTFYVYYWKLCICQLLQNFKITVYALFFIARAQIGDVGCVVPLPSPSPRLASPSKQIRIITIIAQAWLYCIYPPPQALLSTKINAFFEQFVQISKSTEKLAKINFFSIHIQRNIFLTSCLSLCNTTGCSNFFPTFIATFAYLFLQAKYKIRLQSFLCLL